MDGGQGSKAYEVVKGRVVLSGAPDFLLRRSQVAHFVTSRSGRTDCRHCGGEDGIHLGRCEGFKRSLSAQSPRWWFLGRVEKAAFELSQRQLMQSLREALS